MRRTNQAGFTLPELLATVVIVILLGVVAMFLLRETPQTMSRYDSQRQTDTALIVQAVTNYRTKTGALPDGITTTYKTIGSQDGELDLCKILVPDYLTDVPYDPTAGQAASTDERCDAKDQEYTTGYQIKKNDNGTQISVQAPNAQGDKMIIITKKF